MVQIATVFGPKKLSPVGCSRESLSSWERTDPRSATLRSRNENFCKSIEVKTFQGKNAADRSDVPSVFSLEKKLLHTSLSYLFPTLNDKSKFEVVAKKQNHFQPFCFVSQLETFQWIYNNVIRVERVQAKCLHWNATNESARMIQICVKLIH